MRNNVKFLFPVAAICLTFCPAMLSAGPQSVAGEKTHMQCWRGEYGDEHLEGRIGSVGVSGVHYEASDIGRTNRPLTMGQVDESGRVYEYKEDRNQDKLSSDDLSRINLLERAANLCRTVYVVFGPVPEVYNKSPDAGALADINCRQDKNAYLFDGIVLKHNISGKYTQEGGDADRSTTHGAYDGVELDTQKIWDDPFSYDIDTRRKANLLDRVAAYCRGVTVPSPNVW